MTNKYDSDLLPKSGTSTATEMSSKINVPSQQNAASDSSDFPASVAYVVKGFPRLSEVFITNEIRILEEMGTPLEVFVIKKSNEAKSHGLADKLASPIHYLPKVTSLTETAFLTWCRQNFPNFHGVHGQLFRQYPWRYLKSLINAIVMCFRYRSEKTGKLKKVFLKEFMQAGHIAYQMLSTGDFAQIHAHFCHGATTVAMFVSQLTGLPFSFTAHAKDIYLPSLNPGDLLQRKIHEAAFVVTCTGANHLHLNGISTNGTPIHTIRHGLNLEYFQLKPQNRRQKSVPEILAVGRFVKKKGFEHLVEACRLLKGRGFQFHCRIVGQRDEQSELIESAIVSGNLQDMITIENEVTQQELRKLYEQATLFALPCQIVGNGDRDGIPNVLAEAMAMQLPVVSTRISGIPELVIDQENGLLVDQKNPGALAEAIATLLDNPQLQATLGQAARARIEEVFNSSTTTLDLRKLFYSTITGQES